jgi:hypothetical protein
MASKKTVSVANLMALGAERLATILIELAEENTQVKRRLRLELAAEAGGDSIAAQIGKRLTALKAARSFIDWQKRREFMKDLDLQRSMIADRVAHTRPDLALELMWRFIALAEPVLNRVDDSSGSVGDVFRSACQDLGTIAVTARPDPDALADQVFTAVLANDYGILDGLVAIMAPALGDVGLARLKSRLEQELRDEPRKASGFDWRTSVVRSALKAIADAQGDVDGYIALVPKAERSTPRVSAEIGRRLLAAGRADEALTVLQTGQPKRHTASGARDNNELGPFLTVRDSDAWEEAYIDALDATGQREQAQCYRWAAFEQRLSPTQLRAYLTRLPEFDDVEAEERAMAHALSYASFATALNFFRSWPSQAKAAELVLTRASEIDGDMYYLLGPAAQLIEGKHPLAATLLRRAMIEDTLAGSKSSRYKHAARHMLESSSLARQIRDFGRFETHESFLKRMQTAHARKVGFWAQVDEIA